MKKALISGILGQDGSYLADYLLGLGYEVHGIYRRISTGTNFDNLQDAYGHDNLHLHCGDITDYGFVRSLIAELQPDEIYSLAAMSHVGQSFKEPTTTFRVNAEAVIALLDAIKDLSPHTKVYHASTSELFGGIDCPSGGYDEAAKINPRSPYAVAKAAAHYAVQNYRVAYDLFVCCGILFNHGSPRRGVDFVERKITKGVADIVKGKAQHLYMGNVGACRDLGHAKDYVKAMHLMLQQDKPGDYVVATNQTASVKEMLEYACVLAGLKYDDVYRMDERFMRPSDVQYLCGSPDKIMSIGWKPEYNWQSLLKEMFEYDLKSE